MFQNKFFSFLFIVLATVSSPSFAVEDVCGPMPEDVCKEPVVQEVLLETYLERNPEAKENLEKNKNTTAAKNSNGGDDILGELCGLVGDIAKKCAQKCWSKLCFNMKSFSECVKNCVKGDPLGCGNGRLDAGEDCKTCPRDAGCSEGQECNQIPGRFPAKHECSRCGDGVCSDSENIFLNAPDKACPADCNGSDGCNSKDGSCGFGADCRCPACKDKWFACRSHQECKMVGRKYDCVDKNSTENGGGSQGLGF